MIFAGTPRVLRGWSNVSSDVFFSFKPRNNHSATSNSRLLQTPEPCANEIWKLKVYSLPLWSPQRRWKIPPELTNRYVKNEAFIVVVFNDILTLLLAITITIFSNCCYCCCFQSHSHPTGSSLNLHPLANCQCGNASSNSISISRHLYIQNFNIQTFDIQHLNIKIFRCDAVVRFFAIMFDRATPLQILLLMKQKNVKMSLCECFQWCVENNKG